MFPIFRSSASVSTDPHPFDHDLHLYSIPGDTSRCMLCLHGMGGDYHIADIVKAESGTKDRVVSFNFPDYGIPDDPRKTRYGTIQELLVPIYVLNKLIIEEGVKEIVLYGFSAGGGAVINLLSILNASQHDEKLSSLGILHKKRILDTIEKGIVILDSPLKSVSEIIDFRGPAEELMVINERYRQNHLDPIDSLKNLSNLSLNIYLHFQVPDEILSNRDDQIFIENIKKSNQNGSTSISSGNDGGHNYPHKTLWKHFHQS